MEAVAVWASVPVAPFMGAWIETASLSEHDYLVYVAPFMGAWIETKTASQYDTSSCVAPLWEHGLKRVKTPLSIKPFICCSLYGSMD